MCAVVDGEFQGINTGASEVIGVLVSVSAGRGVSRAMPGETLAGGLGHDIVGAVVDG